MVARSHHAVYGLRLSSNIPLPGLPAIAPGPADVVVEFAETPIRQDEMAVGGRADHTAMERLWRLDDRTWRLTYRDGDGNDVLEFVIRDAGSRIDIRWTGDAVFESGSLLVGPVLAAVLHLRGIPCLHASAVAFDGGAVLFLGVPGAGKSTLAAAFARHGHPVLTDDVAALDVRPDGVWIQPAYAHLRLLPDTVRALDWDPERLPAVWMNPAGGDKRSLDLSAWPGAGGLEPASLSAIYVLGPRRARPSTSRVTPVPSRAALPCLVQSVYGVRWLDPARRERLIRVCARLAETIPVRQVEGPDDLASLPQLMRDVAQDAASVAVAGSVPRA